MVWEESLRLIRPVGVYLVLIPQHQVEQLQCDNFERH